MAFFVDFCNTIDKTNIGHDAYMIFYRDNISSVENHIFDIG